MQQFGVQFYQASLTASDIDKLVRFEVLNYGDTAQPAVRGGKQQARRGAAPSKVNWDLLERRIASSEKAYQRQIIRRKIDELVQYYEQCRQARDLPSIPGAVIISCDEKLSFQPAGDDSRVGILKVPEREGHPARDRRPAPAARAARRHRSLRRRGLQRAGDHLRSAARRSRRPDVRDDQREAHAAERVASGQPVGPPAVPRREPRDGARRRPRAQRSRGLAALRRDQAARRRPRPRRAGAARAGAEEAVRRRRVHVAARRRHARGREEVLRQLLQADRARVRRRVERPQVQHPVGVGAARLHPRRARRHPPARSGARRSHATSAPSAASSRRGAAASATCGSRPTAPGSAPARPSTRWRRSCGWRCSIRRGPRSKVHSSDHRRRRLHRLQSGLTTRSSTPPTASSSSTS